MSSKTRAQRKAAFAALAVKRGEREKATLSGASKSMYDSMSIRQLRELALSSLSR